MEKQVEQLQEQLKKQEKLASLGLLSAGIAHEIQNPLNFVINFSKMSNTLLKDLTDIVADFKALGIRTSIFIGTDTELIELAAKTGADRVELYTEPYAQGYAADRDAAIAPFIRAAKVAADLGLGLNAGHDLSLENLAFYKQQIPWTDEVSIGHALICDALYLGLEETIRRYRACLE